MDNRWAFDDREVAENEMRMETGEERGRGEPTRLKTLSLWLSASVLAILW